jgi:hypothetical protein
MGWTALAERVMEIRNVGELRRELEVINKISLRKRGLGGER